MRKGDRIGRLCTSVTWVSSVCIRTDVRLVSIRLIDDGGGGGKKKNILRNLCLSGTCW